MPSAVQGAIQDAGNSSVYKIGTDPWPHGVPSLPERGKQ